MSDDTKALVFDFDAGWTEQEHLPLVIRLFDRDWHLPADCPAETILKLDRLMVTMVDMAKTGEIPDDVVIDESITPEGILKGMVPAEMVDEWVKLGLGYRKMMAISRRLSAHYRGQNDAKEEEAGPNRAARRAAARPAAKMATSKPRKSVRSSASGAR